MWVSLNIHYLVSSVFFYDFKGAKIIFLNLQGKVSISYCWGVPLIPETSEFGVYNFYCVTSDLSHFHDEKSGNKSGFWDKSGRWRISCGNSNLDSFDFDNLLLIPWKFKKAGRVWCGGAREPHVTKGWLLPVNHRLWETSSQSPHFFRS